MKNIAIICLLLQSAVVQAQEEIEWFKGVCKNNPFVILNITEKQKMPIKKSNTNYVLQPPNKKGGLHGNVLYNGSYRSFLDSPFYQNNLMQHFVQTRFDLMVNKRFPISAFLTHRSSNSNYFANVFDVSFQFKQQGFLETEKTKMRAKIDRDLNSEHLKNWNFDKVSDLAALDSFLIKIENENSTLGIKEFEYKDKINSQLKKALTLQKVIENSTALLNNLNSPQSLIESKEQFIRDSLIQFQKPIFKDSLLKDYFKEYDLNHKGSIKFKTTSINLDSLITKPDTPKAVLQYEAFAKQIIEKKKKIQKNIDSLNKQLSVLKQNIGVEQKKTFDSLITIKQKITKIANSNQLESFSRAYENYGEKLTGMQKIFSSITQFGIGRTWIDYSELSVKNIALNGVNIELNINKVYVAAAKGVINYRFRDFVLQSDKVPANQALNLLRIGWGSKHGNSFILTYFNGVKGIFLANNIANGPQQFVPVQGYTIEAKHSVDKNNTLIAEYGRSTVNNIAGKLFNFSTKQPAAWSLKWVGDYPKTGTKVDGFYRNIGEEYQSFTLLPVNSNQEAYSLKAKQLFWKKRLTAELGIRKNDFNSFVGLPNFSNSTVFKTAMLSFRMPKYPFINLGYFPNSQLTLNNNNVLTENQFNTFNAIVSHNYKVSNKQINSTLLYTKFFSNSNDQSLQNFNAINLSVNNSAYINKFVVQCNATYTKQFDLKMVMVETILGFKPSNFFTIDVGVRHTNANNNEVFWGSIINMNLVVKKLATIQLNYNKTNVFNINRQLVPLTIGNVSLLRDF